MTWFEKMTIPGSDAVPNEDRVAVFGDREAGGAVVLDGVTTTAAMETGCSHGTPWFVDSLIDHVVRDGEQAVAAGDHDPMHVLAGAIGRVARSHEETCDLRRPMTPQATVAVVLWARGTLVSLVLSDCYVLLERDGAVTEVLSDYRIHLLKERRDRLPKPLGLYRNTLDGFQTAAADPVVAFRGQIQRVPLDTCDAVFLCTDGAARYVDELALGDWNDLARLARTSGLERVASTIRSEEALVADQPGVKRSDDLAMALIRFD